jgi:hypothetical protein
MSASVLPRLSGALIQFWPTDFCHVIYIVLFVPCARNYNRQERSAYGSEPDEPKARVFNTSTKFLRAQRAYLTAADLRARKSETELKEAAQEYRKAIEPYDAALQEFHQYLLAAEPSETIAAELEHTERLIEALNKEKDVGSKLIERHMEMVDQNIELTSHRAEEEEE